MTTTRECLKVANLRTNGYVSLEDWLHRPDNVYVGRQGRIFITSPQTKEKRVFHYRASKWANPFNLKDHSLEESLKKYKQHLVDTGLINNVDELKGKNLGCWCEEKDDCHTQVLIDLVENN